MTYEEIETTSWKPEKEGEEVEGKLLSIESNVGANKSMLYTIGFENKPIAVWGSVVLDGKMLGVKVGDQVKIVYEGKGAAKAGQNAPKLFKVFVDKEDAPKEADIFKPSGLV